MFNQGVAIYQKGYYISFFCYSIILYYYVEGNGGSAFFQGTATAPKGGYLGNSKTKYLLILTCSRIR